MSAIKIHPTKLQGTVNVPPSKSIAHRLIIAASLANGKSRVDNIAYSDDIIATIEAMKALGTKIEMFDDYVEVDGSSTFTKQDITIDCKESGSTIRFMVPISIVKENKVNFVGTGNLGKRPLNTFYEIFDRQEIAYEYQEGILDLKVEGKLQADHYKIPGNISSQFITGLLFALPLNDNNSIITITSNLESRSYIDLTLDVLNQYGIIVENNNYQEFIIKGKQKYKTIDSRVEADFSQAAFYLVAGAIGNDVTLTGLNLDSKQGDKLIIDYLKQMNVEMISTDKGIKAITSDLAATIVDASQCPDIIPVLSVALALASGHSEVVNASRLRIKECDRLAATRIELNKLGSRVEELIDSLLINGIEEFIGNECSSHDDHRMAMALAIASTRCNGDIIIDNKECVSKSYPNFWEDFVSLGGKISEC